MNTDYNNQPEFKEETDQDIEKQIRSIFNNNKITDLRKFIKKRDCLNNTNQWLDYLFHIIQSAGVLTTTIAAGYDMKDLVWVGVGMNILASLVTVFQKSNDAISKKIFKDIQLIKSGNYIDEGNYIEVEDPSKTENISSSNIQPSSSSISANNQIPNAQPNVNNVQNIVQENILKTPNIKTILNIPLISETSKKPQQQSNN